MAPECWYSREAVWSSISAVAMRSKAIRNAGISDLRWKQMWRHIDTTIPAGSKLVIAGDMNTEVSEVETMKRAAQP